MARKTKEEAEQTRKLILETALDTFCELGYSKTTFDEIAKRINLTKGAVYWHFNNKSELLGAIIKNSFDKMVAEVSKIVPELNSLDTLREYFRLHAEKIKHDSIHRKFLFFIIYQMEWSETLFNNLEKTLLEIRDFSKKQIIKALNNAQKSGDIPKNIDISKTSYIILGLWIGLFHIEIEEKDFKEDFPTLLTQGLDMIFNSIRTKKA